MIQEFGPRPRGDAVPARPLAPAVRALGFAGLLPAAAALAVALYSRFGPAPRGVPDHALAAIGAIVALVYGAVILSFLGGIWWGFAMLRPARQQSSLAILAVLPSLAAAALVAAPLWIGADLALILLGSVIMLTLLVDRRLTTIGMAPADWMRLRVPLSLGLGLLIVGTGILAPR